jgi:hypothetical protein
LQVIFVIGEIDCREGLLVAVERDRYASVSEGIDKTVDIFCNVLSKLLKTRKFKVGRNAHFFYWFPFVHPCRRFSHRLHKATVQNAL